jgi:hypothetical protein
MPQRKPTKQLLDTNSTLASMGSLYSSVRTNRARRNLSIRPRSVGRSGVRSFAPQNNCGCIPPGMTLARPIRIGQIWWLWVRNFKPSGSVALNAGFPLLCDPVRQTDEFADASGFFHVCFFAVLDEDYRSFVDELPAELACGGHSTGWRLDELIGSRACLRPYRRARAAAASIFGRVLRSGSVFLAITAS